MHRRDFMKLIGLASGASVLSSCGPKRGTEKLIPYLVPPEEDIIPGAAVYVQTTCTECPANCGVSVKVREGSPVKLEGVPGHPLNDGTLCIRGQAALWRLYHPERLQTPLLKNPDGRFEPLSWEQALAKIRQEISRQSDQGLANVYLSGHTTGALAGLIDSFCRKYQIERLPEFEHFSYANIREANNILFGRSELPAFQIDNADFLLTIGADILETFGNPVANARQLAQARSQNHFNWLHVESHASLTGFQAHQRLTLRPQSEIYLLLYLLHSLVSQSRRALAEPIVTALPKVTVQAVSEKTGITPESLEKLVDQMSKAERPLLIAGGLAVQQAVGLEVAVLTGVVQWLAGMVNNTIDFARSANLDRVGNLKDLQSLTNRLQQDQIGVIFLAQTDPVKNVPAAVAFTESLAKARLRVAMTDLMSATASACDLVLPLLHGFESWGEVEPRKGLKGLIQPALSPIYPNLSEGDILLQLMAASPETTQTYQSFLLSQWQQNPGPGKIEDLLSQGYFEIPMPTAQVALNARAGAEFVQKLQLPEISTAPVLCLVPSIRTYDGRSRQLPLLQEIPDPISTITYGSWVSVGPRTAAKFQLKDKEEIQLSAGDWRMQLPVKIQPGLAEDVYMAQLDSLGILPTGSDARTGEVFSYLNNITVAKTGVSIRMAILSGSPSQQGRGLIPMPVHPDKDHGKGHHGRVSLYPDVEHKQYRWGLVIDLDACIGCSACIAACYAENNVPIVGAVEHIKGREMSWLHLEPYYEADDTMEFLPMLCQQCTYAPCEPVCPVYAAYHHPEGLNAQVYNRCVGTRYCANSCPYKVRRFNWFDHRVKEEPLKRMFNPDISMRGKGVMEKCTFCVQRIRAAHDVAKDEQRAIQDGEVIPACAQTCPTRAITFGNLLDHDSRVYQLAHSERAYRVLEELGTEPGVYYLKSKVHKNEI